MQTRLKCLARCRVGEYYSCKAATLLLGDELVDDVVGVERFDAECIEKS